MKASDLRDLCMHDLPRKVCGSCKERSEWGKLNTRPYREAIADIVPYEPPPRTVRSCEKCKRRGACKGNRIAVRLPRPRVSYKIGPPVYAPSWDGEIVERPKVRPATHRHKGKWLCDKCDPERAVGVDVTPDVLTDADIFV